MPFIIVRQDITKMKTDAIVNAANTQLAMGGGVCGAIFRAAGADRLQAACNKAAPIKTGDAAITPGFDLPARYVIHTAGPVYSPQNSALCEKLLYSAYTSSLALALEYDCKSIAFPLISSGIYGYPKAEALRIATSAIKDFLALHDMDIYLAVFDKAAFSASSKLLGEIESYIDENYVDEHTAVRRQLLDIERRSMNIASSAPSYSGAYEDNLDSILENMDEPFNAALLRLIDEKGKTDPEVYKKANIDRKLFSKIRNGKGYTPSKRTVLALAVALELSLEETDALLEKAGYALSHSRKFDVIIEYFIINKKYDIYEINEVLFQYDQPLLCP